ncbi:MAG: hypothetical protein NTX81_01815 [Candidatus Bathyarchaeota archaeon]|nr:hypothetical protein [Candidatus Bathyarchaeota archaeon]
MKLSNIIYVGILIRLIMMPFSAHPFDVYIWYQIVLGIIKNPVGVTYFPPMLFYTLVPIAYTYNSASTFLGVSPIPMADLPRILNPDPRFNILYVMDPVFNLLVKMPFLVSDILLTIVIFRLVKKLSQDQKKAEWAAALWFLNPYLILISAVWGMFDTLPALFSLASIWLLTERRFELSASALAVAVAYKLYPILFLIPTVLFIRRLASSRKVTLRYLSVFTASSLVLFLPAIPMVLGFSQGLLTAPPDPGALGFGLTYWSILLMIPLNQNYVAIISTLIVIACLTMTYLKAARSSFDNEVLSLVLFQLCCVLSIFIGFRFVCEQFFVWALPYMILLVIAGKVKVLTYKILSIVALAYALIHGLNALFFFLPTWPWLGSQLLSAVRLIRTPTATESPHGYEVINQPHVSPITLTLSVLGIIFTIIVAKVFVSLLQRTSSVQPEFTAGSHISALRIKKHLQLRFSFEVFRLSAKSSRPALRGRRFHNISPPSSSRNKIWL